MLILTSFTMSSLYLKSLSQKHFYEYNHNNQRSLDYAKLSLVIDNGNWRSSKLLGKILHNQRYYSLDYELKIEIARQELNMYRKALKINK